MAQSSLRTVVLCCVGLYQPQLIRRAAKEVTLAGVVLQTSPPPLPEGVPVRSTAAIHGERNVAFLRRLAAEYVRENVTPSRRLALLAPIAAIRHGIINLDTGLPPSWRGASCNLTGSCRAIPSCWA